MAPTALGHIFLNYCQDFIFSELHMSPGAINSHLIEFTVENSSHKHK